MNKMEYFKGSALGLWNNGDYINALSRMYYAVYHVIRDRLEVSGIEGKNSIKRFIGHLLGYVGWLEGKERSYINSCRVGRK